MYFFLFYPMPLIPFRVSVLYSFHRMFQFWERERERERDVFCSDIIPISYSLTTFDGIILHELILFILMVIAVIQFCANIWKIRLFVLWWILIPGLWRTFFDGVQGPTELWSIFSRKETVAIFVWYDLIDFLPLCSYSYSYRMSVTIVYSPMCNASHFTSFC